MKITYKGKGILIDPEDLDILESRGWSWLPGGYLVSKYRNDPKTLFLHVEIAKRAGKYIEGLEVDHRDHNKSNLTRENLRAATRTQNEGNKPPTKRNRTGYKGVSFEVRRSKYVAQIRKGGQALHLGYFEDPVEAAKCYDAHAKEVFGDFAWLNFPS